MRVSNSEEQIDEAHPPYWEERGAAVVQVECTYGTVYENWIHVQSISFITFQDLWSGSTGS